MSSLMSFSYFPSDEHVYRAFSQQPLVVDPVCGHILTVEEAAEILRLKRSQAYELTRIYRMSGGTRGLPVVVFGRWLRVPKAAILHFSEVPLPRAAGDHG